jgi:hypothetical protein
VYIFWCPAYLFFSVPNCCSFLFGCMWTGYRNHEISDSVQCRPTVWNLIYTCLVKLFKTNLFSLCCVYQITF